VCDKGPRFLNGKGGALLARQIVSESTSAGYMHELAAKLAQDGLQKSKSVFTLIDDKLALTLYKMLSAQKLPSPQNTKSLVDLVFNLIIKK
jgi:hypothetical protein